MDERQQLEQLREQARARLAELEAKASKPAMDPRDVPGIGESLLIGAGRTFDRIGKGMQQGYYTAKSQFESPTLSSLVTGETPSQAKLRELKAAADEESRLYAPLQDARPWATGIGEALPGVAIPAGGAATLLGNAVRMGVAGAAPGLLEYGSAGERLQRGLLGGLAGAAAPVAGAVLKTAYSAAEPLFAAGRNAIAARTLRRVAGDQASAVEQRLANAQPLVPGSMPTAAQVAENGGIAALERSASASNPAAYTQRAQEQASARLSALRGIAQDDAAVAAAEAARKAATGPMYQQATGAVYKVDDTLQGLLERPIVQKAMQRAKAIAENDGRKFDFSTTSSRAFAGVGLAPVTTKQVTGQGLQDLKMALDAMLKDPASGIAGKEIEQAKALRGRILNWMETANPEYKAARQTYADMSRPINEMQVGQALVDKLTPALSDYGALGQETAATFARQLRNSEKLVKDATGFEGAGSIADVMSPRNMQTLNGIAQDLARKTNGQNLGRGVGSDTFQKLAMQNIAEQSGMPKMTAGLLGLPGINRATSWAYRDTDQQMQELLAGLLLDPKAAAKVMQKSGRGLLPDNPVLRQLLTQPALRVGLLGAPAAADSMP